MTRKRSLREITGHLVDDDDEDDFVKEALRDQRAYQKEVEADEKEAEEARKANRTYVKGRKKKRKPRESASEKQELFDNLRRQLRLSETEANDIRAASVETLKQKRQKDKQTSDEAVTRQHSDESSENHEEGTESKGRRLQMEESESESDDEIVLLPGPSQMKKATQVEVPRESVKAAILDSESEEEAILLSAPRRAPSTQPTASTLLPTHLDVRSNGSVSGLCDFQKGTLNGSQSLSSEDDIISLSIPAHLSQARKVSLTQPKASVSNTQNTSEDHTVKVEEERSASTSSLLPPDGASRPTFPFTLEQRLIGPLDLGDGLEVPASINRFLRDYQREGVKFFYNNYKQNRGALLGDDMGLGKTIQVIAFLAAIMKKSGKCIIDEYRRINSIRSGRVGNSRQKRAANETWPTALIVCPASVMTNWQNELDTWGYFEHDLLDNESMIKFEKGRLDILITSHQMAKQKIKFLRDQNISVVFVDECHTLKNPNSQMTQALNSLSCLRRFGLSGTAIQNRLEEFWTLLDWCNPNHFGSIKDWELVVAEPIRLGQSSTATPLQLTMRGRVARGLRDNLLPQVFLRRTKDLIKAQLPNKRDNIVFCPLTDMQIRSYKSTLAEPEVELIRRAKEPCDCGRVDEEGLPYQRCRCCYDIDSEGRRWNYHMLKYIMLLQRCSNHLALVFPDPTENIEVNEESTMADQMRKSRYLRQIEIVKQLFPDNWQSKQNNKINGFRKEYCGKWLVLSRLLKDWKERGDKVLLFSLNLRLLDWISYFVEMEGYSHLRLDGSTPQKKRQGLVNDFNRDPSIFIFLISTTAGGTGLNLTGANKVVIFDPHWNPAHDLQAMDRAYRFGQRRDVDVYRLIGQGSLEETIYDRQVYKQQLGRIGYDASEERRYFQPGDAKGFQRLFELNETRSVTRDFIKACDLAEASFAMKHLVQEAEVSKIKVEDDEVDMNNLLAETSEIPKNEEQEDSVLKILQMTGIEYTHRNDSLLGGSKVETAMAKRAAELTEPERPKIDKKPKTSVKKEPSRSRGAFPSPPEMAAPSWPPQRKTSRAK